MKVRRGKVRWNLWGRQGGGVKCVGSDGVGEVRRGLCIGARLRGEVVRSSEEDEEEKKEDEGEEEEGEVKDGKK